MELCAGCLPKAPHAHPSRGVMKARHFARRFSLQPTPLIREDEPRTSSPHHRLPHHSAHHTSCGEAGAAAPAVVAGTSGDSEEPKQRRYRVVVMGAARVGKTAIIHQFLYDTFTPKYTRTVEEMHHGEYEVSGLSLTLDILDTSGSYEFPAMRELSINTADGFILVYDITDADSFNEVRQLRQFILDTRKEAVPMVVVANKGDLEDDRAVCQETAETLVLVKWENGYIEASAKDNHNVLQIFKELLNQAKIKYALSPAVKRRRQSMPNVGMQITPAQLSHLQHLRQKSSGKRNSCVIA